MGVIPDVSYFQTFGCKCLYTLPNSQVQKLDPRGKIAIFVGYAEAPKAYTLADLKTHTVVNFHDVLFDIKSAVDFEPGLEMADLNISSKFFPADHDETISLKNEMTQTDPDASKNANVYNSKTIDDPDDDDDG